MAQQSKKFHPNQVLQPQATAKWLILNTALTFEQIAQFCGLHILQVKALADGEAMISLRPADPIYNYQLTLEEIDRCQKDPNAKLKYLDLDSKLDIIVDGKKFTTKKRQTKVTYMPRALRKERVNAAAWIIQNYEFIPDYEIAKLVRSTKSTVLSIRDKSYKSYEILKPKDPVILGICKQGELDFVAHKYAATQKSEQA